MESHINDDINILIVAQNVSSRFGGEAFLPLKYFQILRRRGYSVRLIAHSRNREDLETALAPHAADILYIEDTVWHRAVWKAGGVFPKRIREVLFGNILNFINERFQARLIRRLVREGSVDVIHQPIPVSPRYPSAIHGFGVPVVIGPMNGGMSYPPGYEDYESRIERNFVRISRRAAMLVNRIVPGKRRAAALLVANERTRAALPVHDHPKVVTLVENGVDLALWCAPERDEAEMREPGMIRLVFMGRLVDWKALDVTLQAVAGAREAGVAAELDILGDGEERERLQALCAELGLGSAVRFHGFKPQAECAEVLRRSDALILNSLHECGGAVVLEAMSMGLPVIASDWGGPADYLDAGCGLLVSPAPREDFARRLADTITLLARDPDLRRRMGREGARKVRDDFDWDKKVDRVMEIYREGVAAGR